MFGDVQCDMKLPEHQKENFANFPIFFKITNVCRQIFGSLRQEYAEKEELASQLRRTLNSSFKLTNCTIITPLFFWGWDLYAQKIIASLNTIRSTVLTCLCNPLLMIVVKRTRIQTVVLLQKLWCCLLASRTVMKLWIAVVIQLHDVWVMKKHMKPSTKKFKSFWQIIDKLRQIHLSKTVI